MEKRRRGSDLIISFRHKFIFVAIPKTATHSIRNALRPHLASKDWEQCRLFEKKVFPHKYLASLRTGHISCQQVKPFLFPEIWKELFKFAVVRNPYKRFFSFCRFINRKNNKMQTDPLGTMKKAIVSKKNHKRILFKPQYKFVTDKDENLMVDYVCRLENLQKDFDKVCQTLKLPETDLKKLNTSPSSKHTQVYDQELKEMILDFYRKDFELLNYPITLAGNSPEFQKIN